MFFVYSSLARARARTFAVFFAIPCLLLCGVASAEPRDGAQTLLADGVAALEQGRYEEALARFEVAESLDPNDSQPAFFQGVAFNRLGRTAEALRALERARSLGSVHPDLEFELGWALLRAGRYFNLYTGGALRVTDQYTMGGADGQSSAEPRIRLERDSSGRFILKLNVEIQRADVENAGVPPLLPRQAATDFGRRNAYAVHSAPIHTANAM